MNLFAAHRNRFANACVKALRINRVFDAYLGRFPLTRETPFGIVYKVDSIPSLVVASELFSTDVYTKPISIVQPTTFVDLGCNVGYFPLLVAEVMRSRFIKGLCVEPNPHLHPRAEFHLSANGLVDVHLVKGVVAGSHIEQEIEFFLNPSHIASSLMGTFNPRMPVGGHVRKIKVPVVEIASEWQKFFPNERVHLLKVDIEGTEIDFLKANSKFLEQVDAVLIEWHCWITTLEEVTAILNPLHFALEGVCHVDQDAGTAFFRRCS